MSTATYDTTITFRTNSKLKKQAKALYEDLGMDLSTAMNVFMRQSVSRDAIPFEISRELVPNEKTQKIIAESLKDKNTVGPFNSIEELMEDLNADD